MGSNSRLLIGSCLVMGFIFLSGKTQAQNWKTTGDSGRHGDFLGTTNNAGIDIKTNGTLRLKVDSTGKVVVKGKLVVDSNATFNNPVKVNGQLTTDSMVVTAITGKNDSMVRFGHDAILINYVANRITWTPQPILALCGFTLVSPGGLGIGNGNTFADGTNTMALGTNVQIPLCPHPTQSMVLGAGVSTLLPLVNSTSNSMYIGFNSTIPTVFVGTSGGAGTTGKVGIGTINPITALHVATVGANIGYITSDPLAPAGVGPLPNTDGMVIANASGTMVTKLNFNGNASDVLLGNGNFGPAPVPSLNCGTGNGSGGSIIGSWCTDGNALVAPAILGTTTAFPLQIYTFGTQRMYIDQLLGFVGIGNGFSTPNFLLDVSGGDIDVLTSTSGNGYRLGSNMFLWEGVTGNVENVFCGVGAGISGTTLDRDVYVGNAAGTSDVLGEYNTFVGFQAGQSNVGVISGFGSSQNGDYNTFVGDRAGNANTTGQANCYYGPESGFLNVLGSANCTYGDHSGQDVGGNLDSNSFYGFETSFNMQQGNSNVMIGDNSGWNTGRVLATPGYFNTFVGGFGGSKQVNPGGNYNVTLGYGADAYTGSLLAPGIITDAVAIGAEAIVLHNNQVILGNNAQYVGIGESNDPAGPQWNLEIATEHNVAGSGGFYTTPNGGGGTGFSGLRFRDLRATSTPYTTNPGPGVLALDAAGRVIYVTEGGGGSAPVLGAQNAAWLNPSNKYIEWGTNPLLHNTYVPMGDAVNASQQYNAIFQDQSTVARGNDDVGIGIPVGGGSLLAKLDVRSSTETYIINSAWDGSPTYPYQVAGVAANILTPQGIGGSFGGGYAGVIATGPNGILSYSQNFYPQTWSIQAYATTATPNNQNTGVWSEALGPGLVNLGVVSNAMGGTTNYGVQSVAENLTNYAAYNYGVYGDALGVGGAGTSASFGVYANATGSDENYAVYAAYNNSTGVNSNWGGWFDGAVYASAGYWPSDSNLKDSIKPIPNALGIIMQLKPRSYLYDTLHYPQLGLPTGKQYGLIAQDVAGILPTIVRQAKQPLGLDTLGNIISDSVTFKAIDYIDFIPFLIGGAQQQQLAIDSGKIANKNLDSTVTAIKRTDSIIVTKQKLINDSLRSTLDSLRSAFQSIQNCLSQLCGNATGDSIVLDSVHSVLHRSTKGGGVTNIQNVTLSGLADAPLLYQNIPNPFSVGTKINYYLPQGTLGATIVFYDNYGSQIKQVQLNQTGNGTLNITPDNLTNGIYSYSLIVNGNAIDTKRMVLEK